MITVTVIVNGMLVVKQIYMNFQLSYAFVIVCFKKRVSEILCKIFTQWSHWNFLDYNISFDIDMLSYKDYEI